MHVMKRRKTQSGFVHNGLSDNGDGAGWVGQAITGAVLITDAIFGRKGDSGSDNRRRKREALASVGFNWKRTKGANPADYNNIDGWPDISLDNIRDAYNQYGEVVVQLHNQGVFNKDNTQSMQQIEQIIRQHGGGNSGGTFFNAWGSQSSVTGAGMNYTPWIMGAVGLAGIAVLANVMKQGSGTKKGK